MMYIIIRELSETDTDSVSVEERLMDDIFL